MDENDNKNLTMLKEAFEVYDNLENKDREYTPIFNSKKMLEKIQEYYEKGTRKFTKEEIDEVNVELIDFSHSKDIDANFALNKSYEVIQ